jgi:hypothetical protein
MRIGSGEHTYEWVEDWARIPDTESARTGWAHSGVAVSSTGDVFTFHQGEPAMLAFNQRGELARSWRGEVGAAHAITLVRERDMEYLWLADNGARRAPAAGYEYQPWDRGSQAIKTGLDGRTMMRLERPDLPVYREGRYSVTSVAVFEERFGGNGDIWVADGYGQSYVHRYDRTGRYLGSINGEEGRAGAFKTPHAVFVDVRKPDPELYVADRSNRRVQVYDLDGRFKRSFGEDFMTSPSAFVVDGDHLVIAELRARLTVVDGADRLVCYLGENEAACQVPGWPNNKNAAGEPVRNAQLTPGKFNSPHGLGIDARGNLYVSEWLIGGRTIKLAKVSGI